MRESIGKTCPKGSILTATGIAEILFQVVLSVIAGNLACAQKLLEFPAPQAPQLPGFAEGKGAACIQGQSQLLTEFALGFVRRIPQRIRHIGRDV